MRIFKNSALLYNAVKAVLESSKRPWTISELKSHPDILPLNEYDTKINNVLTSYHKAGLVRRLPPVFGNSHLYEWVSKDNGTVYVPDVGTPEEAPVELSVEVPEIRVEQDRIVIVHNKCRIIVEF